MNYFPTSLKLNPYDGSLSESACTMLSEYDKETVYSLIKIQGYKAIYQSGQDRFVVTAKGTKYTVIARLAKVSTYA